MAARARCRARPACRAPRPRRTWRAGHVRLAEPDRVSAVLTDAGWRAIDVESRHASILIAGGGSLDETVDFLRTGSMCRTMLARADAETAVRAVHAARDALAPHLTDDGVRLDAAVWCVTARN